MIMMYVYDLNKKNLIANFRCKVISGYVQLLSFRPSIRGDFTRERLVLSCIRSSLFSPNWESDARLRQRKYNLRPCAQYGYGKSSGYLLEKEQLMKMNCLQTIYYTPQLVFDALFSLFLYFLLMTLKVFCDIERGACSG